MIDLNTLQSINNRVMTLLKCPPELSGEIGLISVRRVTDRKIIMVTKTEYLYIRTSKKLGEIQISDDLFSESIYIMYKNQAISMKYIAECELRIIKV